MSLLVALGSLASVSAAQSVPVVVPQQFDNSEAGGVAFWALSPFVARRQLVLGQSHLGALVGKTIDSITVRRNMGDNEPLDGGLLHLQVWLSHSRRGALAMSTYFAGNRGPDQIPVFDNTISVPPAPAAPTTPAPWTSPYAVKITFAKRFTYQGGPLCIEILTRPVQGQTPPWFTIDAIVEPGGGTVVQYGDSCVPGMGTMPAGADGHSVVVGSTGLFYLRGLRNTGQAFCMFGTSRSQYGTVALPVELSPLGAPGCHLHTNPLAFNNPAGIESPVGGSPGLARWGLLIPPLPALAGAKIYTQWAVVDPGLNPLNLTFSNGVELTIGAARPHWDTGWIESPEESSPIGLQLTGRVPVLRING